MGEDDYNDDYGNPLAAGFGSLGSSLFGAGPTFNLGSPTANAAGSEFNLIGLLSGQSSDQAGATGASVGNGVSAAMGTLPGESSGGNNTANPTSNSSGSIWSCLTSAGPTGIFNGGYASCLSGNGNQNTASSWFGRGLTAFLGLIFVIAALYLFGSSNLSDAISNVADHAGKLAAVE